MGLRRPEARVANSGQPAGASTRKDEGTGANDCGNSRRAHDPETLEQPLGLTPVMSPPAGLPPPAVENTGQLTLESLAADVRTIAAGLLDIKADMRGPLRAIVDRLGRVGR